MDIVTQSLIKVGVVVGVHGIKGDLKVRSFTENPENISNYEVIIKGNNDPVRLDVKSAKNGVVIAKLKGIDDRNEAEEMIGKELYIEKEKLPELGENQYYHFDLIGLEAKLENGQAFGTVTSLYNFGAGDLIEITTCKEKRSKIFPFNKQTVPQVKLKEGFVLVNPPEEV